MSVLAGRYRGRLAALTLALAAAWVARRRRRPALPWVTVSPLNGTPDASPTTQISFLGRAGCGPFADQRAWFAERQHNGRLEAYATGTGASFLVTRSFRQRRDGDGQRARDGQGPNTGASARVSPSLAVRNPAGAGHAAANPAAAPGTVASFGSVPSIHPPTIAVTTPAADPSLGDVFLTPAGVPRRPGR